MKYQVLFSLKNNEEIFMNVICCNVIGALRVNVKYSTNKNNNTFSIST